MDQAHPQTRDDEPGGITLESFGAGYRRGAMVVHGVTGQWSAGRLTALLGPNGAGKSTLLRGLVGAVPCVTGGAALDGVALAGDGTWRAQRVGYVPQQGGVRFGFTVREVVAMGRHAHGQSGEAEAVGVALSRFGLDAVAELPFVELSGGQQRRVLLARAWAQVDGALGRAVLADEPTAGLDLEHVESAMSALHGLARRGLAVVVVLHDLNLAARWADRVWLMDAGRVVASGTPEEVITPEVLEPVYRVPLRALADGTGRTLLLPAGGRKMEA